MIDAAGSQTMVPCIGGTARSVGWLRVPMPLPLEIERDGDGIYVLEERADGAVYVFVASR
jgi:hypothetical protein